jgi:hypothetical protein
MLTTGQVSASGTASHLCNMPAGPCLVVITNDSASAGSAYVGLTPGTSGSLSATNGIPVPAGQSLPLVGYPGSAGGSISVVAASTATVGFAISSAQ